MKLKRSLYGPHDPRGPSHGRDVKDFVKRSLNKVETNFFPKPPGGYDSVYNAKVVEAIKILQDANGIKATGNMGVETFDLLWREYADAYAKWVYRTWTAPPPKPIPPPLVEPKQGFDSLHKSLWGTYSLGIQMGLEPDLGTYNAASFLPSGTPSDHAVNPAYAFDLGFEPDIGWQHPVARSFFYAVMGKMEVEYVILGDRIWSRPRAAEGIRTYMSGGHLNHVHVSGNR